MAAMGFTDMYKFYNWASENEDELLEYVDMAYALGSDRESAKQLENPVALRERLRVAGGSGERGLFRKKNLTRKIERLVGFAINRGPAWRHFEGTNSEEQLDNAINALESLGDDEFESRLPEVEGMDPPDEAQEDTFADQFGDSGKRKRVLSAAQKFRQRIGGKPIEPKKPKEKPYTLPGLDPVYPEKEEEVAEAAPAPKPERESTVTPSGQPWTTGRPTDVLGAEYDAEMEEAKSANVPPTTDPVEKQGSGIPPAGQRSSLYESAVKSFEDATGKKMTRVQRLALQSALQPTKDE
jgi:hypothetical protein